ncbi:M20 aminoacylase family protein [Jannaschia sp. LMIT008]|uniref:M20 aminoacylase family protein n=1 Tax=Jannaschia maritima TaxID=3032585 RepID=UPI002811E8F5|nr:M20 aminoacylase family protein [Jannaschia sp. LMIT008]
MPVKNRFSEWLPEITAWRRDIHAHPELGYDTHRTAALVADKLRAFGCDEVVTGIGRTGVVGVIRGRHPGDGVVGLRADMDALPIEEATGADHASTIPGKMHACGHDGHTAMLLGAARYLAETRNFAGTAIVVFQPAEEGGGGGLAMCEDGLMDRFGIQEVYGMHNWPGQPQGRFSIRPGPFFASTDEFTLQVRGVGGHAAKPQIAVDTTLMGAHLVTALQSIASRNADPVEQVVVSVTSFRTSSDAYNVLPSAAELRGTVRTMDAGQRDMAERRIKAIAAGIAATFGGEVEVRYDRNYPVMANHDAQTAFAADVARDVSGDCGDAPLVMGGEDFAYMLLERPGAYILLGNGDSAPVHHPEYDFEDQIIPAGCSWLTGLVEQRLKAA